MKMFAVMASITLLLVSCSNGPEKTKKVAEMNPFFETWNTPFAVPPFDKIKESDYLPAFEKGIQEHNAEIQKIADNTEAPTFANTLEAMDRSGQLLTKVSGVFYNLLSADTSDNLQKIAETVAPELSKHHDDILMNEKLFARIKAVYDQRDKLELNPEQSRLLEETWKDFVRGGANLNADQKARLREINKELSLLTLKFGKNILKETNRFEMVVDNKADLAGLPDGVIQAAAETAEARGHKGKWVFTLDKPSLIPFLQYSSVRPLRQKMFEGYINMGNHGDELDNKSTLVQIVNLRLERANLLGYKSHAAYILADHMAKTPENVFKLMDQVWKPAMAEAKREATEFQKMIDKTGGKFKLQPWDWWYYAEKVKKAKYDLDESEIRPYFELENVRQGAFMVANKLYGITFTPRTDLPVYQKDVKAYEVKDADGTTIGIYYADNFPRASKRGGAWMSSFRKQERIDGKNIIPVVYNVTNFTKPTSTTPALLSLEEVKTLFHEFGHALHGLLSNCTYEKLSGTDVALDFVELPSQIMENWATEPAVLKMYARHYKTGKVMPDALIQKIQNSGKFNQGFETGEYMAAAYLDMDWHTLTKPFSGDPMEFEKKAMDKIGLIPQIVVRYRSPYFRHIFSGGYSAGYYSYLWAAVLDADAFSAFQEHGLFDQKTAKAFRDNILSKGGTEDPMVLYKKFRGRGPKVDALLKRKGFI